MAEKSSLMVGVKMKEVACRDNTYENCTVLHADSIGLMFEVQRTVAEGGTIETVVSQVLVPWTNVNHITLMEEKA
jgi:hypothetical protein